MCTVQCAVQSFVKDLLEELQINFPEIPNQRVTSSPYVTETPSEIAKGMIFRICNYNYEH